MNRKQILSAVSFSLVIAALCCCGNKAKQQNADNNTKKFALPTIPADIREPKDRAAWLLDRKSVV